MSFRQFYDELIKVSCGGNCSSSNFLTCWTSAHQCIAHPSCTVSPGRTQTAAEPCSVLDCAQQRQISLILASAGDLRGRLMTGSLFSEHSSEQFRREKNCVDFKACRLQDFLCKCSEGNRSLTNPILHSI